MDANDPNAGIPASFSPETTKQGLVLRIRGEEGSTALAALAFAGMAAGAGWLWFAPCYGLAVLLTAFAAVLWVQSLTRHELELALDEVRLVRRVGPVTLRRVRVPLSRVNGVRINPDRSLAVRVVELDTPEGPLRVLADGHSAEDVEWLRDTLEVMTQAAAPASTDGPARNDEG